MSSPRCCSAISAEYLSERVFPVEETYWRVLIREIAGDLILLILPLLVLLLARCCFLYIRRLLLLSWLILLVQKTSSKMYKTMLATWSATAVTHK